jgi:H+/Cl- antiporter ClcA
LWFALIASGMTVYYGPAALGSGIAECMGMLNGVHYPDYVRIRTFITKWVGVAFTVSAGLCGGKEGPLVHMGYCVGHFIVYLPFKF